MNSNKLNDMNNSLLTHFQLVGEFHSTFNHPIRNNAFYDCFQKEPKLLYSRLSLIKEKLKEFITAVNKDSLINALCNICYVTYGTGHSIGIDIDCLLTEMNIDISTSCDIDVNNGSNSDFNNEFNNEFNNGSNSEFNNEFNNEFNKEHKKNTKYAIKTIKNIINRFIVSIETQDIGEIADHLIIILKTVYDIGRKLNFNMDHRFRKIHRLNMTKVSTNIEDKNNSLEMYTN